MNIGTEQAFGEQVGLEPALGDVQEGIHLALWFSVGLVYLVVEFSTGLWGTVYRGSGLLTSGFDSLQQYKGTVVSIEYRLTGPPGEEGSPGQTCLCCP